MTLFIDQLDKARQIWTLLVNIPVEDADLLRWVAVSGLPDFESACLQAHSHVRASGRLPNNLNRWIKAYLYGKKAERVRREKITGGSMIAERIDAVQRQLEADNPGFAEYLAQQPEIPIVNLDDIVEQTDIYDARSVARSYFIFVYNEFARRNSGDIPQSTVELMLRLFEDAMVGDPNERITRHRALLVGDAIEIATGPTGSNWYERWGASIDRLHDFERKLRAKRAA